MVKKMPTKLNKGVPITDISFFNHLSKITQDYDQLVNFTNEIAGFTTYTARVLKVVDNGPALPPNIFQDEDIKPTYGFYARILGDKSPHSHLQDPCKLFDEKDPESKKESQLKLIQQHTYFTTVDKNLIKPQVGAIVNVELPPPGLGPVGRYLGLLVDTTLPPPAKKPRKRIEKKGRSLLKKLPIRELQEEEFQHQRFVPFTNEAKKLFMESAERASQHEKIRNFKFSTATMTLPPGIPASWGDYATPEGKALHKILQQESQGYVGALNYTFRNAVAKRDGYKGGKMPNPDWYGKKYAKTWSHILKKLRKGKVYLGARSSASGLGQMTLSNVRKFYPSGLDGIGDPYEEAAGMLLYIKSRYGSPVEAWAQYGGCSPDGKYSRKHIPAKKRGKPCNPPYDAEKKPGIAGLPRPNSPNKRGHDHEGY